MSPLIISPLIASLPLLFCLAFHFTNATTTISTLTDTILPGQSLNSTYWLQSNRSAGRCYYLGFSPGKNSTKQYLVIYRWYLSYDDIVWVANREHPFPNSSTVLTFNQDGNLVISDGSLLYDMTNTSGGKDTYAKLLDTAGTTGWPLTSWQSDANPAPGLFSLQYLGSRKELVLMKGSQQYWSSPVLIDHLADIFVIDGDYLTWPSTNDMMRRIRLDIYGNLLLQTYIYNFDDWEGDWFSFCLHYNDNTSCTTTDTIRPGQSLNTSETIVSANGRYELGFFPSQEDYYYVGIRYYEANVAVRYNPLLFPTVVWVANREDSFLTSSSILTFNPDGNLVISGGRLPYALANTSGGNDTYARLLDTGNLVLKNRASHILWQSIDYPTDTLLPGMKLKDAKTGWSLTSNTSIQDPAPGRFSLQYLGSRKELIVTEESEPYWISSLSGVLADIFVIDGDYITWPSNYTGDIISIRLDVSGNFILQTRYAVRYWNSTTNGSYPNCRDFSLCNETADAVFGCDCFPGFIEIPDQGCIRKTAFSCSDGVEKVGSWMENYRADGINCSSCYIGPFCLLCEEKKAQKEGGGFVIVRFGHDPKF
ncbi:hypothetical protein FH972_020252 [Carpinus fangiana]|uniref:Bulb-type lectin domain-containing protein n=1 Tax=Carpinus fangiana TaxID=176857 RepID=A0A5N6RSV9_9ROSI|nr:hypothetical protein FH972_020252 [Carpinus fangiana]